MKTIRLSLSLIGVLFGISGIFGQFWEGAIGPFRLGKLARKTPKLGNLHGDFWSIKKQITRSYYTN